MKQYSITEHVLQIRRDDGRWAEPAAGMFRPAVIAAQRGQLLEAIAMAYEIQTHNYGDAHDVRFRVRSVTETFTVISGDFT